MADAVVVALYRHGITEENKRRAFLGWTDAPLSDDAIVELENRKFKAAPCQWLVSSDLQRCVQTANILFPNKEIYQIPEFREMSFGLWEGKVHDELAGNPQYEEWLESWVEMQIPGGESAQMFNARVESGWKKVNEMMVHKTIQAAAIVTHGGVIRYLLSSLANEERQFWDWKVPHGSGFELIWNDEETFRRGERCTLLREVPLTENPHG
ncbi:histidine phosphatase family protein [Bacillus benzoevorans]|uniref:Alpha-ribazole phosphatase n=1 Tax=Bacillus benzoevorans TaxID=1456 RepID=A0A7X0LXE2_9BACI|nr:histidine phosphatase family protein [Bacillus benzoevorans]MBB6447688.1 alpha-ribazole phosphatase [Bacillus benzoevorans]